jgi:regulator of nucleoside diphosphate kinase
VQGDSNEHSYGAVTLTVADFANLSLLEPCAPLQRVLQRARVVPSDAVPPQVITMNSHVVVVDDRTGERRVLSVVYPEDADADAGRISVRDESGAQLLGASPGQTIEYQLPTGMHRLRIEKIIYQPEDSLRTYLVVRG